MNTEIKNQSKTRTAPVIIQDIQEFTQLRAQLVANGKTVGFVPTMGALHPGHASLLRRARLENDISVLSIYVNPTQFDNPEDLNKYPSTLENDKSVAAAEGVDFILLPQYQQIYPDCYHYKLSENELSQKLCGAHRPGHFDGVLTVVMKLLNIVQPTHAYFGEKDQQQLQLIRGMVDAFFMPVKIIACPIFRESDGLAMSSRNVRLSSLERKHAPQFYNALQNSATAPGARLELEALGFEVDYIEDVGGIRYGAIRLGSVRLIDNVQLDSAAASHAKMTDSSAQSSVSSSVKPFSNVTSQGLVPGERGPG